ncbi:MAG: protein translocase subunit SecF [Geminicoccaceae bacterium]|nr:protein translocase subunit SecF [Geminicoccaceae bacterium]
MRSFRLVPDDTHVDFMRYRLVCLPASLAAILLSLLLVFWPGLNYGIDFEGGLLMEVETPATPDLGEMRDRLGALDRGGVALQEFGAPNDILIRLQLKEEGEAAVQEAVTAVKSELEEMFGEGVSYRRTEVVGPKVSEELLTDGLLAIAISIVAVLIYIWFRFEWQYGLGAVAALLHDTFTTIGLFALTGLEVNLSTVAAVLTIVGYSLNDTVVVFDRVRENVRRYKSMPMLELLDLSINETLARTLMTSLTTLLALVALWAFGGEVIRGFTLAMIWGVLVGTYSTVYIATPVLVYLDLRSNAGTADGADKTTPGKPAPRPTGGG